MSYVNPSFNAKELQGNPLNAATPTLNQAVMWDGAQWIPETMDATEVNNDSGVSGATVAAALDTLASQITNPPLNVVSTATSRTMLAGEDVQLVTAGGQTITLFAIPASGTVVRVKRAGTGGGSTVVNTVDAATIDGSSSFNLGNYASCTVLSDGTNWHVI